MKKLTSVLLSLAMLGGMTPAIPAEAANPSMFDVVDAVILQRYLHGKYSLSKFEFDQYDLNRDENLNIYDLILLKKSLIEEKEPEETEQPTEFHTDVVAEADCNAGAWLMGLQKNPVICTSSSQLENNLKSMFTAEIAGKIVAERYDAEFFKEHDLVIDFRIQGEDDRELTLNGASMTEDTIKLNYRWEYIDGFTETGIRIMQAAIPKITHQYGFDVQIEGETALNYEYTSMMQFGYFEEPVLIDTYEKYQEYLFPDAYQGYTKEFFETKALYVYTDEEGYPIGSQRYGYRVSKKGDKITITIVQRTMQSTETPSFMDILTFDKADIEGAEFEIETIIVQA